MHKVKKSKEKRYDWETSESVFQVFKILSEQEKLSLTEIANKLNKNKSTITNKIRSLLDTGLVTKQYEGKEMFYSANKSLLIHKIKNYNKEIKSKYLENINDAINYTNNFTDYELLPDINDPQFYGGIENKFIPNFGIGMFLNNQNYYVGLSIPKLLHKEITDDNPNNYSLQAEFRHYYLEGGLIINLNEDVLFKPTFLAKTTHGVHGQIDLSANFLLREKIWLGAMYRTSNDIGFIAQWIFENNFNF